MTKRDYDTASLRERAGVRALGFEYFCCLFFADDITSAIDEFMQLRRKGQW